MTLVLSVRHAFCCHFIHSDLIPVHGFHCKTLFRNAEISVGLAAFLFNEFQIEKINRE